MSLLELLAIASAFQKEEASILDQLDTCYDIIRFLCVICRSVFAVAKEGGTGEHGI